MKWINRNWNQWNFCVFNTSAECLSPDKQVSDLIAQIGRARVCSLWLCPQPLTCRSSTNFTFDNDERRSFSDCHVFQTTCFYSAGALHTLHRRPLATQRRYAWQCTWLQVRVLLRSKTIAAVLNFVLDVLSLGKRECLHTVCLQTCQFQCAMGSPGRRSGKVIKHA